METIYDFSEAELTRLVLLNAERDRLLQQIGILDQEICDIYMKANIKYKLDYNIDDGQRYIEECKSRFLYGQAVIEPKTFVKLNIVGDDRNEHL